MVNQFGKMRHLEVHRLCSTILSSLGEQFCNADFLAKGSTCSIWKIQSNLNIYALRIIEDEHRVIKGEIDSFIRNTVKNAGGKISRSLICSESADIKPGQIRWSLDEFVEGDHPDVRSLSSRICSEIGKTLAMIHDLPVSNCGRPIKIDNSVMYGEKSNVIDGVMQRFENPFPETWVPGYIHPVYSTVPELIGNIRSRLGHVFVIMANEDHVLCHTDLHSRQLICADGQLNGLIDFGDATILNRNWDLGSILYFLGLNNFYSIYSSYISQSDLDNHEVEIAKSFSVAVAMHHASRSRLPGKSHRLDRAISHIKEYAKS